MSRRYQAFGTATDDTIEAFDERQAQPWTVAELERVRLAALAYAKARLTDGEGRAYWNLLSALDRVQSHE